MLMMIALERQSQLNLLKKEIQYSSSVGIPQLPTRQVVPVLQGQQLRISSL